VTRAVVCISFQDGSGGREIAGVAAGLLGVSIVDEEIVARAAIEAGVDDAVVADVERRKSALMRLLDGLGTSGMAAGYVPTPAVPEQPPSDAVRGMIRSVIEETAADGGAVILAHAASFALGGRDDVLRVLLTASEQTRADRLMSALDLDAKDAARTIKRSDAARADYIKRFYGIGAELPTHYDLVINTDNIDAELGARLIVAAAGDDDQGV